MVALPQIKRKENPLPSQRAHHSDFAESAVISVAAASERARRGLLYVHHRCTPQCSDAAAVVFLPGEIWKAKQGQGGQQGGNGPVAHGQS